MARDIMDIALSYLANRERSILEMKKHLQTKEFSQEEISETITYLVEFNYLDDSRYCDTYVRYAISKSKGIYRIKRELAEKGVTGEIADIVLEEYLDSDKERKIAEAEAEKILRKSGGKIDDKLKGKIGRRLGMLGFNTGMIYDILNNL